MNNKTKLIIAGVASAVLIGGGAVGYVLLNKDSAGDNSSSTATTQTVEVATDSKDWTSLPTTNVTLTEEGFTATAAGTYVLSGSTTGSVVVDADEQNVRLILNGVTIKSNSGAAIQVLNAKNTYIELADGTTNTVADASTRSDEEIDGAIYSADDLLIQGSGTLNLTANYADGIVGKDDLTILGGNINITSVDDSIRGKDSVNIVDGTINIKAQGDGIKSTNDSDLEKGYTYIRGGTITVNSGDDAIKGETKVIIDSGKISIPTSVEGIEAANITINGGEIDIYATDDGINASADTMGTLLAITINGGNITIKMASGDTDAIDSNGDITITGGTVNITAQFAFDFDGTAKMTGGDVTVNGQKVTTITNSMMGGGTPGAGGAPGGNMR